MVKEIELTNRRIVISGLGVVTPLGLTVEDYWQGLINGRSGIDLITLFDTSSYPVKVAAEVKDFKPTNYIHIKRAERTDR